MREVHHLRALQEGVGLGKLRSPVLPAGVAAQVVLPVVANVGPVLPDIRFKKKSDFCEKSYNF